MELAAPPRHHSARAAAVARMNMGRAFRSSKGRALVTAGLIVAVLSTTGWAMGETSPVKTYAYGRATLPGIPDAAKTSPFPVTYLLYVEVPKGSTVSVDGVWLKGTYHAATLKRVASPIVVSHDPVVVTDQKDTLVAKTSNDVYAVLLGEPRPAGIPRPAAKPRTAHNEVVVFLTVDHAPRDGVAKTVKMLKPLAAP